MASDDIPQSLVDRYPPIVWIAEALDQFFSGQPVTVHCGFCGHLLAVSQMVTGSMWVLCGKGCTFYHTHSSDSLSEDET